MTAEHHLVRDRDGRILTGADALRQEADTFLNDAIEAGQVKRSLLHYCEQLGAFLGSTAVETVSGVKIRKSSIGAFIVSTEYPFGKDTILLEARIPAEESEEHAVVSSTTYGDVEEKEHHTLSQATGDGEMRFLAGLIRKSY